MTNNIPQEQAESLRLQRSGLTLAEIAEKMGLSYHQVHRRLKGAKKRERLDPKLVQKLEEKGVEDFGSLHSGWLLEKDKNGSGSSLYFYLGQEEEDKISFVDAMKDVVSEIPKLPPIPAPMHDPRGTDFANWVFLADLHFGAEYGDSRGEETFNESIDDLVRRLPPAEKAVICELGDLLDANDHKGLTPASGNACDVRRDNHLQNTKLAVRLLKRAIYRLLETHQEVEVHMIRGNHDETAYIAVLLALEEHFSANTRVTIVVPVDEYEEEFRVVSWGACAFFPHHGDKAKPKELKDVFADQFCDEWAAAKTWRLIATGHMHHLKSEDMVGCEWRQFRTIHEPNRWARMKGMFNYGSLTALTVHKETGLHYETHSNIRSFKKGKPAHE